MTSDGGAESEAAGAAARPRMAAAIARSIDIYYRDPARTERMDMLHAAFVPAGGLAFDIGAHVGDRTASFLRLGASVVALEPEPRVFRALRLIHGRRPGAHLLRAAAGAEAGAAAMFLNPKNPTVSSLSAEFVAAAPSDPAWQDQVWDGTAQVEITTLDRLIAAHGHPDFIKIDVEGYELEALRGLSTPVPALSFEFTTLHRRVAYACLDRLAALGPYSFNLSLGEEHRLRFDAWLDGRAMQAALADLPQSANSGDVYARLG